MGCASILTEYASLDPVCMVNPSDYIGKKDLGESLNFTSGGTLSFGKGDVLDLAHEYGTRCYLIDLTQVTKNSERLVESFKEYPRKLRPFYAIKANPKESIVKRIIEEGLGIEVTNIHELLFATKSLEEIGRKKSDVSIICNGVSKQFVQRPHKKSLIETAFELQGKKGYDVIVNLSSIEEIRFAQKIAEKSGGGLRVGLRINPGITPKTSEDLATGAGYSRFGIPMEQVNEAVKEMRDCGNLMQLVQLHCHIGSQIPDINAVSGARGKTASDTRGEIPVLCAKVIELQKRFGLQLDQINIGGGIGVKYVKTKPKNAEDYQEFWPNYSVEEYSSKVVDMFRTIHDEDALDYPELCIEPGRWLTANVAVLLLSATDVFGIQEKYKKSLKGSDKWIITDGSAMTDTHDTVLLRQWFEIINVSKIGRPMDTLYNVGGVACDSGDVFAWGRDRTGPRMLPRTEMGDVLAVLDVGAYQQALASNYNMLPTAPSFDIGEVKTLRNKK
jgi:diaminopimelate decarboxylase